MNPLSVSASIAGLVSLADLVFRAALRYVKSAKQAPKEVQDLLNEVKDLSLVLHNLSPIACGLESDSTPQNTNTPKPYYLHECRQLLRRLEGKLPSLETQSSCQKLQSRLKWPFSSGETKEILEAVTRHKQTISIALAADSISKLNICLSRQEATGKSIDDLQKNVKKIFDMQTTISLNKKRREVLNTFNKVDARPEFENNKASRHPMTALWLTESTDFEDWYSTPKARIWCSGIPGAGKSVIAGAIVDECLQRSQANPGTAIGYFFCTYRDPLTFTAINIISSLCAQVALQNEAAYQVLEEYHDELRSNHHLPGQPTTPQLIQTLHQMCASLNQVYLIVDGLDECGSDVESTVDSLISLCLLDANDNINLALLSREESPIRQRVEPYFHWIEIEAHTEDIQLYVVTELDQRINAKKLRLRDMALKDQIMARLISGAQGMFRWVTCQLDHLCDLPTDKARRTALDKLPPTLSGTYERILAKIDSHSEEIKRLVQRTLLLVFRGFIAERLSFRELCEAISVSEDSDTLDDDEIVDEQEILRWCGSLLRTSEKGQEIEFAHYTVQEFLASECQAHPTLSAYSISKPKSDNVYVRLALRYLTLKNFERLPEANEREVSTTLDRRKLRPFYEHASIYWLLPVFIDDSESLFATQLCTFFDIKKTPNFCVWAIELIALCLFQYNDRDSRDTFRFGKRADFGRDEYIAEEVISAVLRPDFTPLQLAAALGLAHVCRYLLEMGANINLRSRFGTPLHCAVGHLSIFMDVKLSTIKFPFPKTRGIFKYTIPPLARLNTVRLLLEAGARSDLVVNTPFMDSTVLCLATFSSQYGHDFEIIVDLIKSGVAVEEEDLKALTWHYKLAESWYEPEDFKRRYQSGKALLKLLDVLELPAMATSVQSRLYTVTLNFASTMRLSVLDEIVEPHLQEGTTDEALRGFVYSAVVGNNVAVLERFVASGRSEMINSPGLDPHVPSFTPLHIAVREGSLDVLPLLLMSGCNANELAENGRTPLHLCCQDEDQDALRALIQHGGNTMSLDENGETIWHSSAKNNAVRILGVLVPQDERDSALQMISAKGNTPVGQALSEGNRDCVLFLMDYCDTEKHWRSRKPPFRSAAQIGCSQIIQKMLDIGVEKDSVEDNAGNPLHFLSLDYDVQCTQQLKMLFSLDDRRKEDLTTPFELMLRRAVEEDVAVDPRLLIGLLPEETFSNPNRIKVLWSFLASELVPLAMISEVKGSWIEELVENLLERGVTNSFEEGNNASVLLLFVSRLVESHLEIQGILVGGNDNQKTLSRYEGWQWISEVTMQLAKDTKHKAGVASDPSLGRLLCEAIFHEDSDMGRPPLPLRAGVLAECPGQLGKEIIGALEADPSSSATATAAPTNHRKGLRMMASVLRMAIAREDVAFLDEDGDFVGPGNPLIIAIESENTEGFVALLDMPHNNGRSAEILSNDPGYRRILSSLVNGRTIEGYTPLHMAAQKGNLDVSRYLVHNMADVDALDNKNGTPLHFAITMKAYKVAEFLVTCSAHLDQKDVWLETPLSLACYENSREMVELLTRSDMVHDMGTCAGNNAVCISSQTGLDDDSPDARILEILLDWGSNVFAENIDGLSAVHFMLASESATYLRRMFVRNPHWLQDYQVSWAHNRFLHMLSSPRKKLLCISKNIRLVRRFFRSNELLQLADLSALGQHSLFCQAVGWGVTEAVRNFLDIGANVHHLCHEHGEPIIAALANSQLDSAKLLVRRGSRVLCGYIAQESGVTLSKLKAVAREWLLARRYTEQPKLASGAWDENRCIDGWVGPAHAEVEVDWHWRQQLDETVLSCAKRRQELLMSLRGKVVKVRKLIGLKKSLKTWESNEFMVGCRS
ncbi:hypothetical protein AK830_g205 [Neonectria ditissima]|uniref:NACHT domain-containing protein n=1 Tax=Neonectria ditissima TaxID=78410 RepID=A0A0P7C3P5_9HYPO|nr:hypothetical protein AK830_g205 [Neonectria ditissima]